MIRWLIEWWRKVKEPFDWDFPYSQPSMRDDALECPDTQPTSPGALDSDLGDLR